MQWGYLKKAITFLFIVNKIFFVRDYMPFRVNTNDSHQRDIKESIYCVKLLKKTKKKSYLVALLKET